MKGDEEKIWQGGCEAYLSKPISIVKFLETVPQLSQHGTLAPGRRRKQVFAILASAEIDLELIPSRSKGCNWERASTKVQAPGQEAVAFCRVRGLTNGAGHDFYLAARSRILKESLARCRAYRDAYSAMNFRYPAECSGPPHLLGP